MNAAPELQHRTGSRVLARSQAAMRYRLRLAASDADLRAAQNLRFIVFNVELNEGLEEAYNTCLDSDRFDAVCDHLLVEEVTTGDIVGTYRLQTGDSAGRNLGFYSAQEFDFTPFNAVRGELLELGRACVHSQHRNLAVLGLLWKGIAAYARTHGARYLIGCSSVTTQSPATGWSIYESLQTRFSAPPEWITRPLAGFELPATPERDATARVPKLLGAYLSLGARICGVPALDREFKTVDFLTILDLASLPPEIVERYLT